MNWHEKKPTIQCQNLFAIASRTGQVRGIFEKYDITREGVRLQVVSYSTFGSRDESFLAFYRFALEIEPYYAPGKHKVYLLLSG